MSEFPQEEGDENETAFDLANLAKSAPGKATCMKITSLGGLVVTQTIQTPNIYTNEKILIRKKGVVLAEGNKEVEGKVMQKKMSHNEALTHVDGIIKCREKQDDSALCDKMLLKKASITNKIKIINRFFVKISRYRL